MYKTCSPVMYQLRVRTAVASLLVVIAKEQLFLFVGLIFGIFSQNARQNVHLTGKVFSSFSVTWSMYEQVSKVWPYKELVLPVVNESFPICLNDFYTVYQYILPLFL